MVIVDLTMTDTMCSFEIYSPFVTKLSVVMIYTSIAYTKELFTVDASVVTYLAVIVVYMFTTDSIGSSVVNSFPKAEVCLKVIHMLSMTYFMCFFVVHPCVKTEMCIEIISCSVANTTILSAVYSISETEMCAIVVNSFFTDTIMVFVVNTFTKAKMSEIIVYFPVAYRVRSFVVYVLLVAELGIVTIDTSMTYTEIFFAVNMFSKAEMTVVIIRISMTNTAKSLVVYTT